MLRIEYEEAAEKASWDLANKNRILGLENRIKSKHFINDNFCQPLYFLFILWPSAIDGLANFLIYEFSFFVLSLAID